MTKSRSTIAWEGGKGGFTGNKEQGITKVHEETLGVKDMFIIWIAGRVSQICTYIKTHQTVYFK